MPYGLLERDMTHIMEAIGMFPEIETVILFGSRAKGNYKPGSDVDLAIQGADVGYETAVRLADILNEEKPLPYFFDVLDYARIADPESLAHIDRVGVVIYHRSSPTTQTYTPPHTPTLPLPAPVKSAPISAEYS